MLSQEEEQQGLSVVETTILLPAPAFRIGLIVGIGIK
jgi:hypothetical protein